MQTCTGKLIKTGSAYPSYQIELGGHLKANVMEIFQVQNTEHSILQRAACRPAYGFDIVGVGCGMHVYRTFIGWPHTLSKIDILIHDEKIVNHRPVEWTNLVTG